MLKTFIFIFLTIQSGSLFAQTIKGGQFTLNTSIDNFLRKYNLGGEYFFTKKEQSNKKDVVSIFINIGATNDKLNGLQLTGINIRTEFRWYSRVLLKDNWNEYLSFTADVGKFAFNNATINRSFFGLSTGVQPKLIGNLHAFFQTDLGYYSNTPRKFGPLFNNDDSNFSSTFGIGAYAGISFFLNKKTN